MKTVVAWTLSHFEDLKFHQASYNCLGIIIQWQQQHAIDISLYKSYGTLSLVNVKSRDKDDSIHHHWGGNQWVSREPNNWYNA